MTKTTETADLAANAAILAAKAATAKTDDDARAFALDAIMFSLFAAKSHK